MKKILFLLAMLPIVLLSCSSDDGGGDNLNSYEKNLVGTWAENTTSTFEVFTFRLNSDKSGIQYVSFDGKIEEENSFTWSADKSTLTVKFIGEAPETIDYVLSGNKLIFYGGPDSIEYIRK